MSVPQQANSSYNTNELVMMGAVLVFLMITVAIAYYVYKRYLRKLEDDKEYDDSKTNLKIDLNTETNKAIVDYLNTLKVVQGKDLTDLEESMKAFVTNLVNNVSNKVDTNKQDIQSNRDKIEVNRLARVNINQPKLQKLEEELAFLRKGVKYDIVKIIVNFVNEYENKYVVTPNQKDMLVNTELFGCLDANIYTLFDTNADLPDVFIKEYKTDLFENLNILLSQFAIVDYYLNKDNLHKSAYETNIPFVYTYILTNKADISFADRNKKNFIFKQYIPKLLNYIINNKLQIHEDIDNLMVAFYQNIPSIEFFNNFLTNLSVDTFINNNEHLFTKCMKKVTEGLYTNWTVFKQNTLNTMFNPTERKLLFVLIPEYLMMMNYNLYKQNKYVKYIDSDYFLNMNSNYLNVNNIVNFATILNKFQCHSDYSNIRNNALKIFLSESLSALCTTRHDKFINQFLQRYNNTVNAATTRFVANTKPLVTYNNFVCDAPDNVDINTICGTTIVREETLSTS